LSLARIPPKNPIPPPESAKAIIDKWSGTILREWSVFASFAHDLGRLPEIEEPSPSDSDYAFERSISIYHPSTGKTSPVFIDLYKRGYFVLKAKKTRADRN